MTREVVHGGVDAIKKGVGDAVTNCKNGSQTTSDQGSNTVGQNTDNPSTDDPMLNHNHMETLAEREAHADKGEFKTDDYNNMNNAFGDMLKEEDKERLHAADDVATRAQELMDSGQSEDGSEALFQNDDGTMPTDEATQMKNMVENIKKMSATGGAIIRAQTAITGDGLAQVGAEMANSSDESTKKGGDQLLKEAAELEAKGDLAADKFNEMSRDEKADS